MLKKTADIWSRGKLLLIEKYVLGRQEKKNLLKKYIFPGLDFKTGEERPTL